MFISQSPVEVKIITKFVVFFPLKHKTCILKTYIGASGPVVAICTFWSILLNFHGETRRNFEAGITSPLQTFAYIQFWNNRWYDYSSFFVHVLRASGLLPFVNFSFFSNHIQCLVLRAAFQDSTFPLAILIPYISADSRLRRIGCSKRSMFNNHFVVIIGLHWNM